MSPFAFAAQALASSRKSATHVVSTHATARALARGHCPWLAADIEATLLDDLNVARDGEGVEITWHAHQRLINPDEQRSLTGQPRDNIARLSWCPGTPLPDRTLYVTCTATAPLS